MYKPVDLTGQNFGEWHVDSFAYKKNRDKYYNCTCSCGTKKIVLGANLRKGLSKSCGCKKGEKIHERFFLDRTGKKYNRLTCIKWEHRKNGIYWLCKCECGNETWVESSNLGSGSVKSCGCALNHVNQVHGMSHTRIHSIWSKMMDRCHNPNSNQYKWYGAEGKTVCDEWHGTDGFIRFYEWALANGYTDDLTIERKDVNRGYSPDNCCWIPHNQQTWNTRVSKRLTVNGETLSVPQLSQKYGVSKANIHNRIDLGWSPEEIVELVPHKRGSKNGRVYSE